jgi:hypothetical protein
MRYLITGTKKEQTIFAPLCRRASASFQDAFQITKREEPVIQRALLRDKASDNSARDSFRSRTPRR